VQIVCITIEIQSQSPESQLTHQFQPSENYKADISVLYMAEQTAIFALPEPFHP
jgi:hypothetical protein